MNTIFNQINLREKNCKQVLLFCKCIRYPGYWLISFS
jgi:hypothetical protein